MGVNRLLLLIARHGTPLVWLNVFIEQLGVPVPAVPTLIVAGALSRDGKLSSTAILTGSVIACLAADWIWFILGRRLGYRVLKTICRISLSPDSCVRDTEARFERWGMRSLLYAKFIPGFATIAPPLAGASNHSTIEFLIYDTAGAFIWAGASVAAGHIFHGAVDRVLLALQNLGAWAVVLVVSALLIVIAIKWWQRYQFLQRFRLTRITPQDVMQMMDRDDAPIIIDVRSPSSRRRDPRRILRSQFIPTDNLTKQLADVPRNRPIILYCT